MAKRACVASLGFILICGAALAQTRQEATVMMRGPSAPAADKTRAKVMPKYQKYGMEMLKIAEADAGALEGGMRAYAYWQLARAYERSDKKKALELLESALLAMRAYDDDHMNGSLKQRLEEDILRSMAPMAPQRVDELITQVDAAAREKVLTSLLAYYEQNKQSDRVLELIYRIGQESEIPYDAASRYLMSLKPEQSGELLQLFTASLSSYRDHPHPLFENKGFPDMIVRFWNRLPKNLVREAIDEVLGQAEAADKKEQGKKPSIAMASDKGSVSFTSLYEYRLFQLLPVLRRIDESGAEELLRKYQQVSATLDKYPEGTSSFAPDSDSPGEKPGGKRGGMMFSVSGGPNDMAAKMAEMSRAQKILADADKHPEQALANIETLQDLDIRAQTLDNFARVNSKQHASSARSALAKLSDIVEKVEPMARVRLVVSIARTYQNMGDNDSAKKAVEKGLKIAEASLQEDSNADRPNKALKAFWPSTNGYCALLRVAGSISPAWALSLLKEIPDTEIKANAEIALAAAWLNVPTGTEVSATVRGNMRGMSVMTVD
ncbi:MAG: hypothetical protein ACE14L_06655 [Terriglobales bacterium]